MIKGSSIKYFQVLLAFFVSLSFTLSFAQAHYTYILDKTTRFDKMGVKDGLSSEHTFCIHQDKYGFIWIGTLKGLNLYDGYEVKSFMSEPNNPGSLNANYIRGIFEGSDGTLWFSSDKGMSKFNRSDQTFTNYMPDTIDINNRINTIENIIEDGEFLWVDTDQDLFLFNKQTGSFRSFGYDTPSLNKGIYGHNSDYIFMDNSGTLWVSSNEHNEEFVLCRFNKEDETFTYFKNDTTDPESFNGKKVTYMTEDGNGIIRIATTGGGMLQVIDKIRGRFKHYIHDESDTNSLFSNSIATIFEDSKGNIWLGGRGGFSQMNKETGRFTNYRIPKRTYSVDWPNVIHDIDEDEEGILWLTAYQGIFKYDPTTGQLNHYKSSQDANGLSEDDNRPLIIDHAGQLWIASFNSGVNRMNKFSNSFRQVSRNNHAKNPISSNYVSTIYGDSKDNLWIGFYKLGGLGRTTLNSQKVYDDFEQFEHIPDDPNSLGIANVNAIFEDRSGTMWFGGWRGLNKYSEHTKSFTRFRNDPEDSTSLSHILVSSLYEDTNGTFWVGTWNGLNIMDRKTGKCTRFLPDEKDSMSISSSTIRVIFEDSQGNLWIGGNYLERVNRKDTSFIRYSTNKLNPDNDIAYIEDLRQDDSSNFWIVAIGAGLIKLNTINNTMKTFTMENGLPSNNFNAIEIDDKGDIWVASNKGLIRLRSDTYEIKTFDIADGLIDLEINNNSFYKDPDGWIYFGTKSGFNVFHPDSLKDNEFIPPVYITALYVSDKQRFFDKPLFEKSHIELKHHENDLSFDFVALNYINPQKNQYAFMLEGYDEEWNYVGNRRTAYYTNLSPGEYTFRVKGSNNDGYWNEEGASLTVIIHPPFWKTWWAYGIYIVLFLIMLYVFRRNELRKMQLRQEAELNNAKAENLAQLDAEKTKFFANVSHEFRTPLTLIIGPLQKLIASTSGEKEKEQLTMVERNARRLQALINQLLSLSKLESGSMKLKARSENIVKLTRLFVESFHSLAEDREIKLEFECDADEHMVYIDRLKFEKIINNLLSNAFKFTEKGGKIKVSVVSSFEDGKDGVIIKVADTGIGIRKERLQHVFDRFFQVDDQQKKSDLGTGIGLALTKEMVELHHGNINAESEFGMGTSFYIFIPMGKDHLAEDEIVDSIASEDEMEDEMLREGQVFIPDAVTKTGKDEEHVKQDSDLPLLLIVEDNPDMRQYIKSYLTGSYQVLEASNGKEGAEMAIDHLPDLIVSDLMMPFMDGNEMTQQLKNDERTSHIPIILLTAKASAASKLEGLETGADDFLTKPFDAAELLVRVKNLIEQRQRLREMLSRHIGDDVQTHIIRETAGKAMSKLDEQFLAKTKQAIEKHMSDPDFSVESLAQDLAMSRSQLHRKLKTLVDISASDIIRDIRLQKAAELLKEGELNITQVTYEIGISSLSYFSKAFKEKYGVSPSEYV